MSKLDQFSKRSFGCLLHSVISLTLINWVIKVPQFHGIGLYEVCFLLLGCAALIRLFYEKSDVFRTIAGALRSAKGTVIAVAVYFLLSTANVLYAQTPDYALDKYLLIAQMLFIGICMIYHIAKQPGAKQGLYLNIGLTSVFIAIFALGKYLFFTDGPYPAIITIERDYNLYSTVLLMGWICAMVYAAELPVSNMRKCVLFAIFTGLLMPMILVSGSRRSYLISFAIAAVVLLSAIILTIKTVKSDKKTCKRAICTLLVCVLCASLASFAMTTSVYELSHTPSGTTQSPGSASAQDRLEADTGLGKRAFIWDAAMKEIKRYDTKALLIGKGASHSSDLYDDQSFPEIRAVHEAYKKSAENPAEKNWMNPHNLFLQDMLNGGVVLLLSLLAVIGAAIFYSIRILRASPAVGLGISLMYGVLLFTFILSSGKGMLAHKFFWLVTFMQILECHKLSRKGE